MKHRKTSSVVISAMVIVLCSGLVVVAGEETKKTEEKARSTAAVPDVVNPALLDPTLAREKAPDAFRVKLETTKGDVVILVNRSWAPRGADRFYNLVKIGYYDGVTFYRVIRGFMAQCGFNGDPAVSAAWSQAKISDDPMTQPNTRGMVTFAKPGTPNSRTTQFFVNYGDNSYLKDHGAFSPFGKVIAGMEVMDSLYAGYGEGAPQGRGPNQARVMREGNSYLRENFPKLDSITRATIVDAGE